jgi:hypothetical protein
VSQASKEGAPLSHEIVYTSAPQGLKPGSRGFCTVASTVGIPKNLVESLESLSGYRHAYELHDPNASKNPINYSHLLLTSAGKKYHVLSRICDAGRDYTQRSNKLAHHVVLTDSERTVGGPAWVLAQPGFGIAEWDGSPRTFPAGRTPDPRDRPAEVCRAWQTATGDAGWAGVLAESFLAKPPKTVSVIFAPGQDLLPLVVEALALLPESQRWDVTFSTYFTRLPAGVDCHWRFLFDGSPEAKAVRANPHLTVIDLCGTVGQATGGALVEVARNGPPKAKGSAPGPPKPMGRQTPPPATAVQVAHVAADNQSDVEALSVHDVDALSLRLERPPTGGRFPTSGPQEVSRPIRRRAKKRPLAMWAFIAASVTCGIALFGVAGGVAYWLFNRQTAPPTRIEATTIQHLSAAATDTVAVNDVKIGATAKEPAKEAGATTAPPTPGGNANVVNTKPTISQKVKFDKPSQVVSQDAKPSLQRAEMQRPVVKAEPNPFKNIEEKGRRLDLSTGGQRLLGSDEPKEIAKIHLSNPANLKLRIIGAETVFADGVKVEVNPRRTGNHYVWEVNYSPPNRLGPPTMFGRFILLGDSFCFAWAGSHASNADAGKLKYCLLNLRSNGNDVVCQLHSQTDTVASLPLDLDTKLEKRLHIPFALDDLPPANRLRLDLKLIGVTPQKRLNGEPLRVQSERNRTTFCFRRTNNPDERFLDLEMTFKATNDDLGLLVKPAKIHLTTFTPPKWPRRTPLLAVKDLQIKVQGQDVDWRPDISRKARASKTTFAEILNGLDKRVDQDQDYKTAAAYLKVPRNDSDEEWTRKHEIYTKGDALKKECKRGIQLSDDNGKWLNDLEIQVAELRGKAQASFELYVNIKDDVTGDDHKVTLLQSSDRRGSPRGL